MKIPGPLVTLLLPLLFIAPAKADRELVSRAYETTFFLKGPGHYRPAPVFEYEMGGAATELILHFEFRSGLFRLSRTGKVRGDTAGVRIEANDADRPAEDRANPFLPIVFQRDGNEDWKDFVAHDFPYPNPEPGYWYTWGDRQGKVQRDLRISFAGPRRLRLRISGVTEETGGGHRLPTLVGITELGPAEGARPKAPEPKLELPALDTASLSYPGLPAIANLLLLEREAPATVRGGESFSYTLRVKNLTSVRISRITVVENGEGDFRFDQVPESATRDEGGVLVWRIDSIGPGGVESIRVTARALDARAARRTVTIAVESAPLAQEPAFRE